MSKLLKYGILIFGTLVLIILIFKKNTSLKQFDSEKWKKWTISKEDNLLRWNMMNDLQSSHKLKGKTKTEIIELLGYPDFEAYEGFYGYFLDTPDYEKSKKHMRFKFDSIHLSSDLKVYDLNK